MKVKKTWWSEEEELHLWPNGRIPFREPLDCRLCVDDIRVCGRTRRLKSNEEIGDDTYIVMRLDFTSSKAAKKAATPEFMQSLVDLVRARYSGRLK